MKFLFKALLAATALIPFAASAQDGEREGRWRGNRGGAEAKIQARNEERGVEAPTPRPQPQAERQRWGGDRGGAGVAARADAGAQLRREARAERREWNGRDNPRAAPIPQANIAVNRPGGPDWNNPRADRARGERQGWVERQGREDGQGRRDRQSWGDRADRSAPRQAQRDDRRFDRDGIDARRRDERRWNDRDGWNQPRRDDRAGRNGWNGPNGFDDRGGWNQPGRGDRYANRGAWNRTWRNDNRYNWSGYRASNRSAYRLPRYYAPYGWDGGYRRFGIGATLSSLLWADDYWIDDPYAYRLPEAYEPYRWVRYYHDALLIDLRTGRVVDVVNDIFW